MPRRLILSAAVISFLLFTAAQSLIFDFSDSFNLSQTAVSEYSRTPAPPAPPAPVLFGIPTDSLEILEGVIQSGETISTLLAPYNVTSETVHSLTRKSQEVFNLRNIRRGRNYTVLFASDSARTARYFVYEPNDLEYIVYDLRDSLAVTLHEREVTIIEREMIGEIHSSLYQSVIEAGGTPQLVNTLADIFAWRLNLNHIQSGDTFKLIFEEKQVNGKSIESGRLKAAYIEHKGQPLYAIGFDQGNGISYYDQEGQSFKKAFLKDPVEFSRISSRYTTRRFHPVQKRFKAHLGTDFAAPRGTPIRTVGDGVVIEAGRTMGNGNYVKIKHNKTYTTQYLHMSKFAKGIRRGVRVSMGQTIGYVGSTGLSTGPHLCYRFWKNGRQVDALKEKLPLAKPIDREYQTAFMNTKEKIIGRMEAMDLSQPTDSRLALRKSATDDSSI